MFPKTNWAISGCQISKLQHQASSMSDIKLFSLANDLATELQGAASGLEKHLQTLIENNLAPFRKNVINQGLFYLDAAN